MSPVWRMNSADAAGIDFVDSSLSVPITSGLAGLLTHVAVADLHEGEFAVYRTSSGARVRSKSVGFHALLDCAEGASARPGHAF